MAKEEIKFEDFLVNVGMDNMGFVQDMHGFLQDSGCKYKIEAAKSGYVFSYLLPKTKKVLLNYVFRKDGMIIRIYGDNVKFYMDYLPSLPEGMIKSIEDAPLCRRLADPTKCNSRCPMGYTFEINGRGFKNCRYSCFMFDVNAENHSAIRGFVERELKERLA